MESALLHYRKSALIHSIKSALPIPPFLIKSKMHSSSGIRRSRRNHSHHVATNGSRRHHHSSGGSPVPPHNQHPPGSTQLNIVWQGLPPNYQIAPDQLFILSGKLTFNSSQLLKLTKPFFHSTQNIGIFSQKLSTSMLTEPF